MFCLLKIILPIAFLKEEDCRQLREAILSFKQVIFKNSKIMQIELMIINI